MRGSLIMRSFLPLAARFFFRHPGKVARLRQDWRDYTRRFAKIATMTDREVGEVEEVLYHLELKEPLFRELNGLKGVTTNCVIYYAIVRLMQPEKVVETGVNAGASSRFILLAMKHNGHGNLHSIDLPNQEVELIPGGPWQRDLLPEGKQTGFLVPHQLRTCWTLHIGNTRDLLPKVLTTLGAIDIFIHDSLHTYDHMMFEFRTAWPYIRDGGVLLSDDTDYNTALSDFAVDVQHPYVKFDYRVGAIRKSKK